MSFKISKNESCIGYIEPGRTLTVSQTPLIWIANDGDHTAYICRGNKENNFSTLAQFPIETNQTVGYTIEEFDKQISELFKSIISIRNTIFITRE